MHRLDQGNGFVSRLLSVHTWLFVLAALPLLGALGLVYGEFDDVRQSHADTDVMNAAVAEVVALDGIQARLLDERTWSSVSAGISALGVDPINFEATSGVDVAAAEANAAADVDASLAQVEWSELEAELASVRRLENDTLGTLAGYDNVTIAVQARYSAALDALRIGVARSGGDEAALAPFRAFDAVSQARQALAMQLASRFSTHFSDSGASLRDLRVHEAQYQNALGQLDELALDGSQLRGALDQISTSTPPETLAYSARAVPAMSLLVEASEVDQAAPLGQRESIDALVRHRNQAVTGLDLLVDAAAADVIDGTEVLTQTATRSAMLGLGRIGLLLVGSALLALGLAGSIGKPLRRLAAGAQVLRDGAEAAPLKPSGPTEVREAMHAINEAAAHIKLAELQAQVLAEGRLDDEVLNESAPGALGQSLQNTVRTLAGSLNEREEFRRRLSHEATHDGLTQLANRKASLAQLQRSVARTTRTGATLAVMFVDLDGFKEINDNYGHSVGDAVLWTLGKRLKAAVRAGDHVGRLGGDEFLIIAEPVEGATEARILAARIAEEIGEPIRIEDTQLCVSVSIGLAISDGTSDLTATELLYDADLAVYRAKELGRSRIELCDESLHQELLERSAIEDALRRAIPAGELTMHYQPILNADTAQLSSLEALIRWDRPGVGRVSPDHFIPIAERSELIREIDNWVVCHVVEQLERWASNPYLRNVPIAINISGRHLSSEGFVSDILEPIRRLGVDPGRLILEVTESAVVDDLEAAAAKLQLLRDQSIRIAIDDFGTGYTSLAHLRTLPIDVLKIDRSFISDESASSLVKLIIDTGHLIGATVTSEGIETVEQAAHFTELGSDALQGYLFARPMAAGAVEEEVRFAATDRIPFLS